MSLVRLGAEGLDRRVAEGIIDQVYTAVSHWREFADQDHVAAVPAAAVDQMLQAISAERS